MWKSTEHGTRNEIYGTRGGWRQTSRAVASSPKYRAMFQVAQRDLLLAHGEWRRPHFGGTKGDAMQHLASYGAQDPI